MQRSTGRRTRQEALLVKRETEDAVLGNGGHLRPRGGCILMRWAASIGRLEEAPR